MANTEPTRLSVNMHPDTTQNLRRLMDDTGRTATHIVAQALSLYALMHSEISAGRNVYVRDPDKREESRLILMF